MERVARISFFRKILCDIGVCIKFHWTVPKRDWLLVSLCLIDNWKENTKMSENRKDNIFYVLVTMQRVLFQKHISEKKQSKTEKWTNVLTFYQKEKAKKLKRKIEACPSFPILCSLLFMGLHLDPLGFKLIIITFEPLVLCSKSFKFWKLLLAYLRGCG